MAGYKGKSIEVAQCLQHALSFLSTTTFGKIFFKSHRTTNTSLGLGLASSVFLFKIVTVSCVPNFPFK